MNIEDWLDANRKRQLDTFLASFRKVNVPPNKAARMEKSTKQHSWTHLTYEAAYRYMRRGYSIEQLSKGAITDTEILKAADYSYQARDYNLHAWLSDGRRKRFQAIVWRILTHRGELPF